MATYPDPDAFFDTSQIEWGNGGGTESIRSSLKNTNGAVYRIEPLLSDGHQEHKDFLTRIVLRLLDGESMPYENQNPPDGQAPAAVSVRTFLTATNGQVYRNADALAQLNAKVDALTAAVQALSDKLGSSGN